MKELFNAINGASSKLVWEICTMYIIFVNYDYCIIILIFFLKENLVESKHHRLARSLRSGPTDRDMKPDAKTRNLLHVIIFVCLWQLLLL